MVARRGTSVLLIPLLGFLALLYPMATHRTSTGSSAEQGSSLSKTRSRTRPSGKQSRKAPWHGDPLILDELLGSLPGTEGYTPEERNEQGRQTAIHDRI